MLDMKLFACSLVEHSEKEKIMNKANTFPGYPHLKKVVYSDRYGRMELLSVEKTSDGFLVGYAKIGTGKHAYTHSVFLGAAR